MSFNPFSNLPLKAGALVLAFLLWVHVATNQTYEHVFQIQLLTVNVPSGLILTNEPQQQLSVQIRATGKQLLGFLTDEMSYRLDLADLKMGRHSLDLTSAQVMEILSGGYDDVELLTPRQIQIDLEREVSKDLPVAVELQVEAAPGYLLRGELWANPATVSISGPESVMRRLRQIRTESQSLVGLVESTDIELALHLPDSLRLSARDSTVVISLEVEPRDERRFDNVSVSPPSRFNQNRYLFTPLTLSLALGVPRSLVDSVGIEDISVSFENPPSSQDSARVPLLYQLPDRVNLIDSSADSVLIVRKS